MNQQEMKEQVAREALSRVAEVESDQLILGIGTGSTAECFIRELPQLKARIHATLASSERSAALLRELGLPVTDLNTVTAMHAYVDGADETNANMELIKGGGAALTREKIVAAVAATFICIVDESKLVTVLGKFPLPVEVIPMARNHVARQLSAMGGRVVWREGVVTDNGNDILDVHDLAIEAPRELEQAINQVAGVVCNGLFAHRPADVVLVGSPSGVRTLTPA